MDMLDRVGLAARAGTQPHMLSGGEQQRVAIARALVRRPRLILADEPTGALDVETGQAVMDLLDTIATESGAALVTITHDLNVAARARTRYRLDAGVLSATDGIPTAAALRRWAHDRPDFSHGGGLERAADPQDPGPAGPDRRSPLGGRADHRGGRGQSGPRRNSAWIPSATAAARQP